MVDSNPQEFDASSPDTEMEYEESVDAAQSNIFLNRWVQIGIAVFVFIIILLIGVGFFVRQNVSKNNVNQDERIQVSRRSYKYVLVFEGVTPMDAAQIRKVLSYDNIPFQSARNGRVIDISVPKEYSDQVKLKLALMGLPEGGIVGFEIFDESAGLGATDYDRRIKYIRAVSGELSRIISTMENINSARVQIVMPEKTLFGEKVLGSASVILNINEGTGITNEQIKGIMHLVASSVENLIPENVAVIDNKGTILSDSIKKDEMSKQFSDFIRLLRVSGSEQESPLELLLKFKQELKDDYENIYSEKVKDVLKTLYPEGSYLVYTTVTLTESNKESTPFEVGKINIAIVLDNTNPNLVFTQDLKQSTFQLVASVVDYVKGRDSIVIELMPFINIESTKNLVESSVKLQDQSIIGIEDSYVKKRSTSLVWIFVVIGLLIFSSGVVVFFVYFLTNRSIEEKDDEEDNNPEVVSDIESREEGVEFALEKFRSFVNNNEDKVIKKVTNWMRNEDV